MSLNVTPSNSALPPKGVRSKHRSIINIGDEERTTDELDTMKKKIIEDGRMDAIFRMGQNLTEKFDNRAFLHPHGMTEYDYKSVVDYRKPDFEKFKVSIYAALHSGISSMESDNL
jgi:hypothetical protein